MEPWAEKELGAASALEPAFPALLVDLARMALGLQLEGLDVARELGRVRAPLLCMVGDRDELAPPAAASPLVEAVASGRRDARVVGDESQHVGHADLILGRRAREIVWEPALDWLEQV